MSHHVHFEADDTEMILGEEGMTLRQGEKFIMVPIDTWMKLYAQAERFKNKAMLAMQDELNGMAENEL